VTWFVDTSALFAVLDADDRNHAAAQRAWRAALESGEALLTSSYVVVETSALVQQRLGLVALRTLCNDVLPVLQIHWVLEEEHQAATAALLAAARRKLSLVDCVSFQLMRRRGVAQALAFDRHFREEGFTSPVG
jgi:predicted nucleic acid-binding protein